MFKNNKYLSFAKDIIITTLLAFAFVSILQTTVLAKVQVQQHSMETTLIEKDQLLIEKLSYIFSEPKRGDIVIFFPDKDNSGIMNKLSIYFNDWKGLFEKKEVNQRYVKRIIGIPGDVIDIKDGFVYVNGEKLDESYAKGTTDGKNNLSYPLTVEENTLFVLGDNREHSIDSRDFGPIGYDQLDGKAILRIYPFSKVGSIN